ncbi:MAG: oprN [Alphaproteobacteria bacterium]|nr:oprN [Alphaproteobacteria bacterium]
MQTNLELKSLTSIKSLFCMSHATCRFGNAFRFIALISAAFPLLGGCALKDIAPPKPDLPPAWQQQAENTEPTVDKWWGYFNDPALDQLVAKAVRNNTDRRLALARIDEARALTENARAQSFPVINGVAGIERSHSPANGNSRGGTNNQFNLGLDASWEPDLFGRIRANTQAARAEANATVADERGVSLALIGEMARQYTLYRLYQEQAALAADNTKAQEGVLRITEARYQQGVESNLELMRSRALLETTRAQIPLYQNLAQTAAYQIDYLTGENPGANMPKLQNKTAIPVIDRDVFMDVPAKIIARRPDIWAAEQRLLSAASLTQVATADLYPSVSISGLLGLTSLTPGNLLQADSKNWSVGGSLIAPLFNFGRIRSAIDASESRQEQALIAYEQTVLAALRDIETAAASYKKSKERFTSLRSAAEASAKAVAIARSQYGEGILSQLDVLSAEQTSYSAQESFAQASADMTQNFIALCKALALMPAGDAALN